MHGIGTVCVRNGIGDDSIHVWTWAVLRISTLCSSSKIVKYSTIEMVLFHF